MDSDYSSGTEELVERVHYARRVCFTRNRPTRSVVRELLGSAGLTNAAAACEFWIDKATLQRYYAGDESVPRVVILVLERLGQWRVTSGQS